MTQNEAVLDYMAKHGSITPREAMVELGIMRLAARIYDLETEGYVIGRENVKVPTRNGKLAKVCKYWVAAVPTWDDGQPDEAQEWHDYDPDC